MNEHFKYCKPAWNGGRNMYFVVFNSKLGNMDFNIFAQHKRINFILNAQMFVYRTGGNITNSTLVELENQYRATNHHIPKARVAKLPLRIYSPKLLEPTAVIIAIINWRLEFEVASTCSVSLCEHFQCRTCERQVDRNFISGSGLKGRQPDLELK